MAAKVIPLKMTRPAAVRIIREIANDTSKVILLPHARKRMAGRRINLTQVYRCLRAGAIVDGPYLDM